MDDLVVSGIVIFGGILVGAVVIAGSDELFAVIARRFGFVRIPGRPVAFKKPKATDNAVGNDTNLLAGFGQTATSLLALCKKFLVQITTTVMAANRRRYLVVSVCAGVILYSYASPYIVFSSIKKAVEQGDAETLAEKVDFPSVRAGLKEQLSAMVAQEMKSEDMDDNPTAALGNLMAGAFIDKVVDAYVTPYGIAQIAKGKKVEPGEVVDNTRVGASGAFDNASAGYVSFGKFKVEVEGDDGNATMFMLHRDGLGWKLNRIILPDLYQSQR